MSYMLNRQTSPEFRTIQSISLLKPEHQVMSNQMDLFYIPSGEAELIRVELVFSLKAWDSNSPLVPSTTFKLMDDGTKTKTSAQIAEEIDYYGSFFQVSVQSDYATLTIYSLRKYLEKSLSIVYELITEATFPQAELDTFVENNIQRLKVDLEKGQYLASKAFYEVIFGKESPYGYREKEEDFREIKQASLLSYFHESISQENAFILVSGKVKEEDLATIERILGKKPWRSNANARALPIRLKASKEHYSFIEKKDALQSSIRIGKTIVDKTHADYPGLQVLNTIFGGYFGSRLMNNIREDKGYTYGIHSVLASQRNQGFFFVGTEVGAEVCRATISEILKEVSILQQQEVADSELSLVRNFMMGSFQSSLENAFSYAEKFKSVHLYNLDYSYYDRYFETIRSISAARLKELANQYFQQESFYTVVAGKE